MTPKSISTDVGMGGRRCTKLWIVVTQRTDREDSESQRALRLGHGWSNPLRQTITVKWDGSGFKLSGHALVLTADVGTFLCPVHLTWGVIRACELGESSQQWASSDSSSSLGAAEGPVSDLICHFVLLLQGTLVYNLAIMMWTGIICLMFC